MGRIIFVAIALLIVSVSVLATESRVWRAQRDTASWHTSKVSRMVQSGGDELVPVAIDDYRPAPRIVVVAVVYNLPPMKFDLQEVAGVPQSHGLRAPPLS
jgi:hypothetical protein